MTGTPISVPSESVISGISSIVNFRDLATATLQIRPGERLGVAGNVTPRLMCSASDKSSGTESVNVV